MSENKMFSIIMPAYNAEKYINEAIESVLNQNIGFDDNVELIIVNDGSTDNTGFIADEYQTKFPNNIKVIHKKNGGISSARNAGLNIATGTYFTTFDSDDTLDINVLSNVKEFIKQNEGIKIVVIPHKYFEARNEFHTTAYKFDDGDRIIDLLEEWDKPQHFVTGTFINREFAVEYAFKEDLKMTVSEDAREIINLLILEPKYGVVSGANYNYRWHANSNVNATKATKDWYFNHLETFVEYFLEKYEDEIPKFVQFSLLYNIQWRLIQKDFPGVLTTDEAEAYKTRLLNHIRRFDDDVILAQKNMKLGRKAFLLNKKYGDYPKLITTDGSLGYTFNDEDIIVDVSKLKLHLNYFGIKDNLLKIEGWIPHYLFLTKDPIVPHLIANDKTIYPVIKTPIKYLSSLGEEIVHKYPIEFNLELNNIDSLEFVLNTPLGNVPANKISFDINTLSEDYDPKSYVKGRYSFNLKNNIIKITKR